MDDEAIRNLLHEYIDGVYECPSDSDLSNQGSDDKFDKDETLTTAEREDLAKFLVNEGIIREGEKDNCTFTDSDEVNDKCTVDFYPQWQHISCTENSCCNEYINLPGTSTSLNTKLQPGKQYILDLRNYHSYLGSEKNSQLPSKSNQTKHRLSSRMHLKSWKAQNEIPDKNKPSRSKKTVQAVADS